MIIAQSRPRQTFQLVDWAASAGFQVWRNAAFSQLGMMSSRLPFTLFPYFDETYRAEFLSNPNLIALLTTEALAGTVPDGYGIALCDKPMDVFLRLHAAMAADNRYVGVDFMTEVGSGAAIHPRAHIAENGVILGANVVVEPNAIILSGSVIGNDVTVQAGAMIGSDGHETRELDGEPYQVPHIGRAVIGDRVVVGYQSMVDRALFLEETIIGEATKIGSLSIMAHGCHIGRRCRIRSRVTVAGATVIGDDAVIGPSVTISNALTIGDGAIIVIGELVTTNVPAGMVAIGKRLISRERYSSIRKLFDARRVAAGTST